MWEATVCGVGWKMWLVREGGSCWDVQIPGSATYSDSEDQRGAVYLGKDGSDMVK